MIDQPQPTRKGKTMSTTTKKSFVDFFTALEEAYAMEIDDTITLPVFEEEMDEDLGDVVVLYDEWNGSIKIPLDRNKEIEFETASRTFRVKGFSDTSSGEFIDTFYIRFLKLA